MGLLPMDADILPPSDDRVFKLILIISRICLYTKSPPKGGLFSILRQKEDKPMSKDEYYELLKAAHERTDWHDRDSIHAYNEYARELRKQMAEKEG